ncbi:VanZ family protein [Olleya sp. YS]|uniref:VanZ family protein n=1 Tax=Olleya sp. YS TaxID=3028318 RepID=UPI0024344F00|nr:VanZ family protein [Olleya sp. YS]WGD35440.1 VanZ family protein [Olleya sp. YS]
MRKLLPILSFGYSITILVLSLISVKSVADFPNDSDKVMHILAHVILTGLWFYTLHYYYNKSVKQSQIISIIISLVFGIIIEVLQHTATQSREADFKDVIANIIGTLVAVLVINLIIKMKVKNY